jgi:NAD(P)-dependent dehydrogenase (short-subunit alcohol dehydrogenase family)
VDRAGTLGSLRDRDRTRRAGEAAMNATALAGQVVVVTGAARGIGRVIAESLASRGARVAIGDIDETILPAAAQQCGAAFWARLDVTDAASFRDFLSATEERLGPIAALINNAGIMPAGPLLDEDDAVTKRIFEINTYGFVLGTKHALARMVPRGRGHVVNIASTMGESSVPGLVSYNASKAAVIRFTDAARLEFRRSGVKFSCVLPGAVNTELATGIRQPRVIRRLEPEDVAAAVVSALESGRSRRRIYVPSTFGYLLVLLRVLPLSVGEFASRMLGAERAVLRDSDLAARRNYQDRVSHS